MPLSDAVTGAPALALFQQDLHALLEGFLNDAFLTRASRCLAPWMVRYDPARTSTLVKAVLRGATVEPGPAVRGTPGPLDVARVIAAGYETLDASVHGEIPTRRRTVQARETFAPPRYRSLPALKELVLLHRDMQGLTGELRGAYLFGSAADLQISPGFSDVDCLVVLRREAVRQPTRLLGLRRQLLRCLGHCYRIDPLQHHGFFVATETDLAVYPEAFLPLLLVERGTALLANEPLTFALRDDRAEARQALDRTVQFLRDLGRPPGPRTLFAMKLLVSSILLLPSLVLHARGRPTYKPESFAPARPFFSSPAWRAVELASRVRDQWPPRILPAALGALLARWPNPHAMSLAARWRPLSVACREAVAAGLLDSVARLAEEGSARAHAEG